MSRSAAGVLLEPRRIDVQEFPVTRWWSRSPFRAPLFIPLPNGIRWVQRLSEVERALRTLGGEGDPNAIHITVMSG